MKCFKPLIENRMLLTILVGETWNDVMAPYVVSFSSRGPNPITPDILKVIKELNT